jgi:mannose-6-phosphate isomerase-like protein (cupin superfamily)
MADEMPYTIRTDVTFRGLEKIPVTALAAACTDRWFNQTLCRVNDCVVRLGVVEGEFHWHHHDDEDEVFYVVSGQFFVDVDDGSVELGPGEGFMVPRGVRHRTRAPKRTVILMIEGGGVAPTGD